MLLEHTVPTACGREGGGRQGSRLHVAAGGLALWFGIDAIPLGLSPFVCTGENSPPPQLQVTQKHWDLREKRGKAFLERHTCRSS